LHGLAAIGGKFNTGFLLQELSKAGLLLCKIRLIEEFRIYFGSDQGVVKEYLPAGVLWLSRNAEQG